MPIFTVATVRRDEYGVLNLGTDIVIGADINEVFSSEMYPDHEEVSASRVPDVFVQRAAQELGMQESEAAKKELAQLRAEKDCALEQLRRDKDNELGKAYALAEEYKAEIGKLHQQLHPPQVSGTDDDIPF